MHQVNVLRARDMPKGRTMKLKYSTLVAKPEETPVPLPDRYLELHIIETDGGKPVSCIDGLPHPKNCNILHFRGQIALVSPLKSRIG